jgi:hypothetical protein
MLSNESRLVNQVFYQSCDFHMYFNKSNIYNLQKIKLRNGKIVKLENCEMEKCKN